MCSFSHNSRTKLSSQPLSRPASSLCPGSRQGLSSASLWHSSGHSRRPALFLLPATIPRGPLPQSCCCMAHRGRHRLGLPSGSCGQGDGCARPAREPRGRETLAETRPARIAPQRLCTTPAAPRAPSWGSPEQIFSDVSWTSFLSPSFPAGLGIGKPCCNIAVQKRFRTHSCERHGLKNT